MYHLHTSLFFKLSIGGRTADEIVNWLLKKTGPAAKAIASVAEAKEFAAAADVVVLGLFKVQNFLVILCVCCEIMYKPFILYCNRISSLMPLSNSLLLPRKLMISASVLALTPMFLKSTKSLEMLSSCSRKLTILKLSWTAKSLLPPSSSLSRPSLFPSSLNSTMKAHRKSLVVRSRTICSSSLARVTPMPKRSPVLLAKSPRVSRERYLQ